MGPETIAIIAQIAEAVLTAAAIALGFYVRSTVSAKSTADCAALETRIERKIDAVDKALDLKIDTVDKALDLKIDAAEKGSENKIEMSISRMHERIGGYENRIRNLEIKVDGNAKSEDLHKVALQLAEMGGDLKALIARTDASEMISKNTASAVKRLEDHILEIQGR
jgi:hypothetical protein